MTHSDIFDLYHATLGYVCGLTLYLVIVAFL